MQVTNPRYSKKFLVILILASGVFNFLFLESNNRKIREFNPTNETKNAQSLVHDQTVYSIDNEYYLSQVDNLIAGRGWKRSFAVGDGDYVRRVPGYSLVYFIFVKIFGVPAAFFWLKIFQLLLFLVTIPLIFSMCRWLAGEWASRIITIAYAFTPFISSWAYFTLTESISPALTLFYIYFAGRGYFETTGKKKLRDYIIASLFLVAAVLTRPYIALAGIVLIVFSVRDYFFPFRGFRSFSRLAAVWVIPVLLVSVWAIRNYMITKELVLLEKAYHPQSLDRMKPEFRGLFTFTKSWGEDGADFTRYHEPFYWAAVAGDTSSGPIDTILKRWPAPVIERFGRERLFNVLKQHQSVIAGYKPYYAEIRAMPDSFTTAQTNTEALYRGLISEFRSKYFFEFYFTSRLKYLRRAILHSNTPNIFLFQAKASPGLFTSGYKALLFVFHVFLYLALFLNLFILRGWVQRLIFVFTPLIFLFFLCFIHREVEARYMLPVLPLLIIGSAFVVERVLRLLNFKNLK